MRQVLWNCISSQERILLHNVVYFDIYMYIFKANFWERNNKRLVKVKFILHFIKYHNIRAYWDVEKTFIHP
jgi:hypothetical protein